MAFETEVLSTLTMTQAEIGGFREIVSSYSLSGHTMLPNIDEVMATLEFLKSSAPGVRAAGVTKETRVVSTAYAPTDGSQS